MAQNVVPEDIRLALVEAVSLARMYGFRFSVVYQINDRCDVKFEIPPRFEGDKPDVWEEICVPLGRLALVIRRMVEDIRNA